MAAGSVSRPIIRGGFKALEEFLVTGRNRFQESPVVLLTNSPSKASTSTKLRHIENTSIAVNQQLELVLRHKLRLHVVTSTVGSTGGHDDQGPVPTTMQVEQVSALAKRVGATTLVAAGTGHTMDLAKAVSTSMQGNTVLVPTTFGAALAATASHALVFHPVEEALMVISPRKLSLERDHTIADTVVAQLQITEAFDETYKREAILAAVTIAFDGVYRDSYNAADVRSLLDTATRLLTNLDAVTFTEISSLCFLAGQLLSYGLQKGGSPETRSVSLALVASLLPTTTWAHNSTTTLFAALAPTFHQAVSTEWQQQLSAKLLLQAPALVTNESLDTLLRHVYASQGLWDCHDCRDDHLRNIIRKHVLLQDQN